MSFNFTKLFFLIILEKRSKFKFPSTRSDFLDAELGGAQNSMKFISVMLLLKYSTIPISTSYFCTPDVTSCSRLLQVKLKER